MTVVNISSANLPLSNIQVEWTRLKELIEDFEPGYGSVDDTDRRYTEKGRVADSMKGQIQIKEDKDSEWTRISCHKVNEHF